MASQTPQYKVTSTTEFEFLFPMKDGKRVHKLKIAAPSEAEARTLLTDEMGQILDQLELADRKEKEKEPK